YADVGMRKQELANGRVEREPVHALPCGVHEHRARPINHVAGGHLAATRLQQVFHLGALASYDLADHREDGADGNVHVDVGRAVERIEQQQILAALETFGDVDDV